MVKSETGQVFDEKQIVVFNLGEEEFGVNITEVREIIKLEKITTIPNTKNYIKGVINLRGKIIVVVDLALKLALSARNIDKNTRILVVEMDGTTIGMIVDNATEVLRLSGDKISKAPAIIKKKIDDDYLEGVGIIEDRLLILLDLTKVLESKEIETIKEIKKSIPDSSPEEVPKK